QAEDGIRYDLVTGVQTCALPIYWLTYSPFVSALTSKAGQEQGAGNLLNAFTELGHQIKPDAASELTRVTGGRVIHYLKKDSLEEIGRASCRERVALQEGVR